MKAASKNMFQHSVSTIPGEKLSTRCRGEFSFSEP